MLHGVGGGATRSRASTYAQLDHFPFLHIVRYTAGRMALVQDHSQPRDAVHWTDFRLFLLSHVDVFTPTACFGDVTFTLSILNFSGSRPLNETLTSTRIQWLRRTVSSREPHAMLVPVSLSYEIRSASATCSGTRQSRRPSVTTIRSSITCRPRCPSSSLPVAATR